MPENPDKSDRDDESAAAANVAPRSDGSELTGDEFEDQLAELDQKIARTAAKLKKKLPFEERQRLVRRQQKLQSRRNALAAQRPERESIEVTRALEQMLAPASPNGPSTVSPDLLRGLVEGDPQSQQAFHDQFADRLEEAARICLLGAVDPTRYAGPNPPRSAYYILPPALREEVVELAREVVFATLGSYGFLVAMDRAVQESREVTSGYLVGAVVRNLTISNIQTSLRQVFGDQRLQLAEDSLLEQAGASRRERERVPSWRDWNAALGRTGLADWEIDFLFYRYGSAPVGGEWGSSTKGELSVKEVAADLRRSRTPEHGFNAEVVETLDRIWNGLLKRLRNGTSDEAIENALRAIESRAKENQAPIAHALGRDLRRMEDKR